MREFSLLKNLVKLLSKFQLVGNINFDKNEQCIPCRKIKFFDFDLILNHR